MKLPLGSSLGPHVTRIIQQADAENHKRNRDVEIGQGRLILTSPDGSRFSVVVANDGALSATAL